MSTTNENDQARRAAAHQAQLAAMYIKQGKATTLREAYRLANQAAPEIAALAGAHPDLMPGAPYSEGQRHYALASGLRRPAQPAARTHVSRGLSDSLRKLQALTREDVVRLLTDLPGKGELTTWLDFLRNWVRLQAPPPPAGQAGKGPGADASNILQEEIFQEIRQRRLREKGYKD